MTGSGIFGLMKVLGESCVFTFFLKNSHIVGSPYQEKF